MADRNAIVLAVDANWFGAAAFVVSQVAALGPPPDTDIILASESPADIEKAHAFGLRAQLLPLDTDLLGTDFPLRKDLTQAAYYRLFLPDLLAAKYGRILYLDVDTYIHGPKIFDLFRLDMGGHAVAAVRDANVALIEENGPEIASAITNAERRYFNSGVLLVDTAAYGAAQIKSRVLATITEKGERLLFQDQSALNMVLDGNWLELSPAFNAIAAYWGSFGRDVSEPVIAHFAGPVKPWHGPRFAAPHPARRELEAFLKNSPWTAFLSRFYNFSDAWNAISSGEPLSPPPTDARIKLTPAGAKRLADYLRTTAFADVEQGITELRLDRIPAGL